MPHRPSRRRFLAASAVALTAPHFVKARGTLDRLNVAVIGVANRGADNLAGVAHEAVVALCDVDPANAAKARAQFPKAAYYTDYRKLFDAAGTFDAVVVSTPDHSHALPTAIALTLGKHVYCEKPLARTVGEVRHVRNLAAARPNLVTQMGTQIHAGDNYRRVVEVVRSGRLGPVTRVHVWNSSRPVGGKRLGTPPAVKFDLDVWRGPLAAEVFDVAVNKSGWNFAWPHFHWRWWWEFGGGTLADLGCHYMDLPFWALGLTAPTSVVASGKKSYTGDNTTPDVMRVDYRFPAAGDRPAVHLTWQHGVSGPDEGGKETYPGFASAVLFEGEKGKLVADYGKFKILPDDFAKGLEPPAKSIPKSVGHHKEWTEACKGNGATTCPFAYSGGLTEAVLLGNVAYRAGREIAWDAAQLTTGSPEADRFVWAEQRTGWRLPR